MGDSIGGIPTLSDRRLSILQKQLTHSRKRTTITNDKLKDALYKSSKSVDKHKQSDDYRSWQKTLPVKNALVEIRALNKCLRRRRESSTLEPELTPRNGVYDGATLDSMRTEVESIISEKAPRERRLRKVEQLKSDGFRDGRLVDYRVSMKKFQSLLTRPRLSLPTWAPPDGSTLARGERPLGDMFSGSDSPYEDSEDGDDSRGVPPRSASADGARTLHLPPIQAGRTFEREIRPRHSIAAGQRGPAFLPSLVRRASTFGPY